MLLMSIPFHPFVYVDFRRLISILKITNLNLALRILKNNKSNIYSNLRDKRKSSCIIHATFTIIWKQCDYVFNASTESVDVEKSFLHYSNVRSSPYRHTVQFNCNCDYLASDWWVVVYESFTDETVSLFEWFSLILLFNGASC